MRRWLALLGVVLPVTAFGQEACPADWLSRSVGRYEGELRTLPPNSADAQAVTTIFELDTAGHLKGRYIAHEQSRDMEGTLTVVAVQPCRGEFHWRDRYGQGPLIVSFLPQRFFGFWGASGDKMIDPLHAWDGMRPGG